MVNIAVLDDYQHIAEKLAPWRELPSGTEVQFFYEPILDSDILVERLSPFDVIVTMRERTRLPEFVLERLPSLQLIAGTGRTQAHIDLSAAKRLGIVVCGTDGSGTSTVELTWGLILAITRGIPQEEIALRAGKWQQTVGIGLEGKTMALLGLGRIGSGVARIAPGFGMDLIAWTPTLTQERASKSGARCVEWEDLFIQADILSIHIPLNRSTRGLVGSKELALLKSSSYLINTSRGPIVDEEALLESLSDARIAGAALDVYDNEPLLAKHPFTQLKNVVLTPHLGYVTTENLTIMYTQCVENIRNFLNEKPSRVLELPL
jgi:phosphoglycerate dehydrogenase-like enzyme